MLAWFSAAVVLVVTIGTVHVQYKHLSLHCVKNCGDDMQQKQPDKGKERAEDRVKPVEVC